MLWVQCCEAGLPNLGMKKRAVAEEKMRSERREKRSEKGNESDRKI